MPASPLCTQCGCGLSVDLLTGLGLPLKGICPGCHHHVFKHVERTTPPSTPAPAPASAPTPTLAPIPASVQIIVPSVGLSPECILTTFWQSICSRSNGSTNRIKVVQETIEGENESDGAYWLHLVSADCHHPVYWLGESALGKHLYVRRCYRQLALIVEKLWSKNRWALILGSPGIGKSMFRCYLLHFIAQKHIAKGEPFVVILQTPRDEVNPQAASCALLRFAPGGAATIPDQVECEVSASDGLPSDWRNMILKPPAELRGRIYYITDGIPPLLVNYNFVRVLEVSPPLRKRWKPFVEGPASGHINELYMPLATLGEMEHMRTHIGSLTSAQLRDRYRYLGGSVRNVLMHTKAAIDLVNEAIDAASSLEALMSASTMNGELNTPGLAPIPSILVHFDVNEEANVALPSELDPVGFKVSTTTTEPFTRYEAVFASNHIRHLVCQRFRDHFLIMLANSSEWLYITSLQGHLYEEFVHMRFTCDQESICPIRHLVNDPHGIRLQKRNLSGFNFNEFDKVNDLATKPLANDGYYKPVCKSFGAVDFVLGNNIVGNMTLDRRHGISLTSLLKVVKAITDPRVGQSQSSGPQALSFWWVTPTWVHFKRMKPQPFTYAGKVIKGDETDSDDAKRTLSELNQLVTIDQYVILMSPSESVQKAALELVRDSRPENEDDDDDDEMSSPKSRKRTVTQAQVSSRRSPAKKGKPAG